MLDCQRIKIQIITLQFSWAWFGSRLNKNKSSLAIFLSFQKTFWPVGTFSNQVGTNLSGGHNLFWVWLEFGWIRIICTSKVTGAKWSLSLRGDISAPPSLKSAVFVFNFINRFIFSIFRRWPIDTTYIAKSFSITDIQNCNEYCSNY